MKKNILIALGAVTLAAITMNATAAEPLLMPRAASNQIKHVTGMNNDLNLVAVNNSSAVLSPRAVGNQVKTVPGVASDVNPAMVCSKTMTGSPKAIQACTDHPETMPGCNTAMVAPLK